MAAKPALVSPCLIPLHTGKGLGWKGDLTTWETMSAALLVILNWEGNKREVKPGGWEGRRSRSPWCLRTPFTSTLLQRGQSLGKRQSGVWDGQICTFPSGREEPAVETGRAVPAFHRRGWKSR